MNCDFATFIDDIEMFRYLFMVHSSARGHKPMREFDLDLRFEC